MAKLIFELQQDAISITGDISELVSNNYVKSLFYELKAKVGESQVLIPVGEANATDLLIRIRQFLIIDLGFEETLGEKVKGKLKRYIDEERNFKEFSEEAEAIKNNLCKKEDYEEFKNHCLNMKRIPYPLQRLSAYHLAYSQNSCNFSVPGAGKTGIVLTAYSFLKKTTVENKKVEKLLVVGPINSFQAWEEEYFECFGEKPHSKRISAGVTKSEKNSIFYGKNDVEIILISYQGLSHVVEDIKHFLKNNRTMVVLDEAHKIKNYNGGVWATSVLDISKYCTSRVALTGTPLPNGYEDLINLFKFIWIDKKIIPFMPYQLKQMSKNPRDRRIGMLNDSIDPYYLRITKKDLKLPKQINNPPIVIEMSPTQKELYEYIEKRYFDGTKSDKTLKGKLDKAKTIRLMQLATNPKLLLKPLDIYFKELGIEDEFSIDESLVIKMLKNDRDLPNKYECALNIIKDVIAKGGKVIVWTSFVQNIIQFSEYLREQGIANKKLYGEIPIENEKTLAEEETREKIIKEFNKKESYFNVIIANPSAVAESISLHKFCHDAIYLDRTFNAANFIQSKDRIHRYGLPKNQLTNYYYLLSKDSIDEVIETRLKEKEERMLKVIESHEIPLFSGNLEEEAGDIKDNESIRKDYENRNTSKI